MIHKVFPDATIRNYILEKMIEVVKTEFDMADNHALCIDGHVCILHARYECTHY